MSAAVTMQPARAPKERPILFSGPMIRAILAGTKSQTRRVVKPMKTAPLPVTRGPWKFEMDSNGFGGLSTNVYGGTSVCPLPVSPYGVPGDRLWVRETWGDADCMYQDHVNDEPGTVAYFADKSAIQNAWSKQPRQVPAYDIASWNWDSIKKRPSIFMPRWASRITLEVTEVRVERLQEITEDDALAEGIEKHVPSPEHARVIGSAPFFTVDGDPIGGGSAVGRYWALWESINGKRPGCDWKSNPWIWAISFNRVQP